MQEEQRDVQSVEVVHTRVISAGPSGGNQILFRSGNGVKTSMR